MAQQLPDDQNKREDLVHKTLQRLKEKKATTSGEDIPQSDQEIQESEKTEETPRSSTIKKTNEKDLKAHQSDEIDIEKEIQKEMERQKELKNKNLQNRRNALARMNSPLKRPLSSHSSSSSASSTQRDDDFRDVPFSSKGNHRHSQFSTSIRGTTSFSIFITHINCF